MATGSNIVTVAMATVTLWFPVAIFWPSEGERDIYCSDTCSKNVEELCDWISGCNHSRMDHILLLNSTDLYNQQLFDFPSFQELREGKGTDVIIHSCGEWLLESYKESLSGH